MNDAAAAACGRRAPRADELTAQPDARLALLEQLYRKQAARFRRVAFAIVGDAETAEDVVQEAFAKAIVRRRTFRATGDAAGWVWRIVVNTAVSRRRRTQLERSVRTAIATALARAPAERDDGPQLNEHIARLPERQRVALFLRYYADLDYEAIAGVLEIAPGTVAKLLHDARNAILTALEGGADG
jgi:RNA polymerase sigma-70 factor (ECF subfamily)